METKEYKLLDGRTIRAKYDRLGMCKITQECLEAFVKEFNDSYRQAKILEKIKENYALMKADERKTGKWEHGYSFPDGNYCKCTACNEIIKCTYPMHFCPNCGADMRCTEDTEKRD